VYTSFGITGVHHGNGQHANTIPLAELPVALKVRNPPGQTSSGLTSRCQWSWACELAYLSCCMALKFSIGIFLLRISVTRTYKVIIWTVIAVTEIYSLAFLLLFMLACRPSAYFWTQLTGGKGTCVDTKIGIDAFYAYSAVSCVADWTLGVIPVFLVWNLQMNSRTKISVAAILAVGAM
jgi:hypothetical protein